MYTGRVRYIGVDLAWGDKATTGLAVLDDEGTLIDLAEARTDAEILQWLASHTGESCVVAFDAPLIVLNEAGMRDCERLVGRHFTRFGFSCHASSRRNPAFADGGRAARLAAELRLETAPRSASRRRAIEVYPHTAIVQLFGLDRSIHYKHKSGRDLTLLQGELTRLIGHIEGLSDAAQPLSLGTNRAWQAIRAQVSAATRKSELRSVEDRVDAVICAYTAMLTDVAPDRVRTLGDDRGYIVTPVDDAMAARIDADDRPLSDPRPRRRTVSTSPSRGGHVFVARGVVEKLVHDAVVVPTDKAFSVRKSWWPLLEVTTWEEVQALRPAGWGDVGRCGRASDGRPVWFLNVGRDAGEGVEWLADGVREVLTEIAANRLGVSGGRVKPLVGLPMVGIAGGGFGPHVGEVVRRNLDAARGVAESADIDVAFVVLDRSAFAAVQHLRRQTAAWDLAPEALETARSLAQRAKSGELALFLGAGVSIPAGLPSWEKLVNRGLERLDGELSAEQTSGLGLLDRAELVARQRPEALREVVVEACTVSRHALAHALLSGLGCKEVVTTNFDRCFELADADGHVVVLPWNAPSPGAPWLLKMHGDVERPESIVLTRGDFATYDARYRPAASVLQALILTRHVLFVGASMTDDNVLRLAYEVSRLRQDHQLSHEWGTVLDVEDSAAKRALYARDLSWVSFDGGSLTDRARELEIFLDAVACYATDDSSWLLDPDFAALDPEGAEVAEELRRLTPSIRRLEADNPAWERVAETLAQHGAREK